MNVVLRDCATSGVSLIIHIFFCHRLVISKNVTTFITFSAIKIQHLVNAKYLLHFHANESQVNF